MIKSRLIILLLIGLMLGGCAKDYDVREANPVPAKPNPNALFFSGILDNDTLYCKESKFTREIRAYKSLSVPDSILMQYETEIEINNYETLRLILNLKEPVEYLNPADSAGYRYFSDLLSSVKSKEWKLLAANVFETGFYAEFEDTVRNYSSLDPLNSGSGYFIAIDSALPSLDYGVDTTLRIRGRFGCMLLPEGNSGDSLHMKEAEFMTILKFRRD